MLQPDRDQYFAEISASAARLAEIARAHDPDLPVPTCPDWALRQLATHIGRVHRWAAHIVTTRSADDVPFSSVPDGRYPAGPAERAAWLRAGADRIIGAITDAGDSPVWAFGRQAPAGFWARRQSHETMVHRADAELAVGCDVVLDAHLAADGIDEWLGMATGSRRPADGTAALPTGSSLRLQVTGSDQAPGWLITGSPTGLGLQRSPQSAAGGAQAADVTVSGPADRLLLVLVRRVRADDPDVTVTGDHSVLTGWLGGTPF
jgi:uncharacterized protein (TIGR03083 family)